MIIALEGSYNQHTSLNDTRGELFREVLALLRISQIDKLMLSGSATYPTIVPPQAVAILSKPLGYQCSEEHACIGIVFPTCWGMS